MPSLVINPPKSLFESISQEADVKTITDEAAIPISIARKATTTTITRMTAAAAAEKTKGGEATTTTADPASTTFTVAHFESTPDPESAQPTSTTASGLDVDTSLEIDEFHGFDDMDLTGLEDMTGHGDTDQGRWDDLQYMEGGAEEPPAPDGETTEELVAAGQPVACY